ncbi:MAG TPA: Holliday junction branch migration protein RuvA [Desulfotomaculum sp.]|nr:Holliday junction branch migration protein RuvA [Desulfotomaculum sp.]
MIAFLRGKLVQSSAGSAVIEVGGIGYRVYVPLSLHSRLPELGMECRLYTHLIQRDERTELYGFNSETERDLFGLLLGVSGVGPKVALALLSCLSPVEIERAVGSGDLGALQMVPGVGRKTAQRILLELKDKLAKAPKAPATQEVEDATDALVALGYRRVEAQEAVQQAVRSGANGLEATLRSALGLLLKRKDVEPK